MCLYLSESHTRKSSRRIAYKVYKVRDGFLASSIYYWDFPDFPDLPGSRIYTHGKVYSNRQTTKLTIEEKNIRSVQKGIHVFLKRAHAMEWMSSCLVENVVEVEVDPEDHVADGYNESRHPCAVYTQITISEEQFKSALKKET